MKVVAIKTGFYNGSEYRPGAEFDVEDGEKASWFKPVKESGKNKINGETVRAQLGEPSSAKPESAVQTFNLTGDEDHDKPAKGDEVLHGDKLTGFELGEPGKPAPAQDPKTLSEIAKAPVVPPTAATGVKGAEVQPAKPAAKK